MEYKTLHQLIGKYLKVKLASMKMDAQMAKYDALHQFADFVHDKDKNDHNLANSHIIKFATSIK